MFHSEPEIVALIILLVVGLPVMFVTGHMLGGYKLAMRVAREREREALENKLVGIPYWEGCDEADVSLIEHKTMMKMLRTARKNVERVVAMAEAERAENTMLRRVSMDRHNITKQFVESLEDRIDEFEREFNRASGNGERPGGVEESGGEKREDRRESSPPGYGS